MKRQASVITAPAALLLLGLTCGACASQSPGASRRGPSGPSVPLDCDGSTEELSDPARTFHELAPGCLESYVERLSAALEAAPEVADFDLRSGEIEGFPPSSEWPVGGDPRHPDAPSYAIPVTFSRALRWEPWVVTWISRLEATRPPAGGPGLEISKETLGPTGMEIRLSALGGAQVFDVAIGWVAYDTVAAESSGD